MTTSSFPDRELIAEMTAKMLLEINAVHFRADKPFMFTSGLASPVYIDCRKLISYPRIRDTLMDFAASVILREVGFEQFDTVAGGETAGIPFAAWLAHKLNLPMQYVRKKPKGFGRDAQIEGEILEGQRVLLVEDLTTDGGSKINFCEALRRAGAEISDTIVVFYYDIFPQTHEVLDRIGMRLPLPGHLAGCPRCLQGPGLLRPGDLERSRGLPGRSANLVRKQWWSDRNSRPGFEGVRR